MTARAHRPLAPEQEAWLRQAERLEWWTIGTLSLTVVAMFLVMGQSQVMKTAWVEDMLSLVPPIAFLVSARLSRRPPDEEYVNGRARAFDISFLVSAVALAGVGLALVYDSLHALLTRTHPTIGVFELGHQVVWQGWLMIAVLGVTIVPPVVLGRRKAKLAHQLHLKPLHTDADMNKADWMTTLAGIAGILGIGFGLWWADAAAALFIAGGVLKDGVSNLKYAMRDLQDARPETTERGRGDPLVGRVREAVAALDWVERCEVRLHEEGLRICGVVQVRPRDGRALHRRLLQAQETARAVHWRIDEVTATFLEP